MRRLLNRWTLALGLLIGLLSLPLGAQPGPAPAIVVQILNAMGLYGSGYTTGDVPMWSVASRKYIPSSGSGGNIVANSVTSTTWFRGGDGSVTAPTFSYISDTDTGWYRVSSGTSRYTADGTARMQFDDKMHVQVLSLQATIGAADDLLLTRLAAGQFLFEKDSTHGCVLDVATDGTAQWLSRAGADTCTIKANTLTATGSVFATASLVGNRVYGDNSAAKSVSWSPTNGLWNIANNAESFGLQFSTGTAAPTVGTCGTGTITSGSRNAAGQFTATGATACTVTFGSPAWTNAPFCVVTEVTAAPLTEPAITASSTTAITISNLTAGDVINYVCMGRI